VGRVIFGFLTTSKSCRLSLHIVITVEVVMVVVLILWSTAAGKERQSFNMFLKVYTGSWVPGQYTKVQYEQKTNTGLHNILCAACNCGKLWYACRQEIRYTE